MCTLVRQGVLSGTVKRMNLFRWAICGVAGVASSIFAGSLTSAGGALTARHLLQAQEVEVAGPRELIVGNFQGVYKTIDSGRSWITITPPVIASQPILLSHLNKIITIGGDRIWLQLIGDQRFNFTPYSSNDGLSWRLLKNAAIPASTKIKDATEILPNGHVPKGFRIRHMYFASPSLSWAQATGPQMGDFTPTYLLRTTSRGRTWVTVTA